MVLIGRPSTIVECEELIVRVEAARDDARRSHDRGLILDLDDKLIELHAIINALADLPRPREP